MRRRTAVCPLPRIRCRREIFSLWHNERPRCWVRRLQEGEGSFCVLNMDISDWRKKIDEIDRQLVRLLNERARYVVEIGKIKRENELPIREPGREQDILRHVQEANRGPLEDDALRRVFERIVEEGRSLQRHLIDAPHPEAKQKP